MKKIGVIDSGIGGLSLLGHMLKMQDQCEFYYQCDHSNVPYGGQSQSFMLEQTYKMVEKLLREGVELIIIACNTLTAEAIDILRERYDIPFVGIEPFVNFINTKYYQPNEQVGLILTPVTARSQRFTKLKAKLDPENKVTVVPMPKLALIIEEMGATSIQAQLERLDEELAPLKERSFDALLYGCTHYPLISEVIKNRLGVRVYDPHVQVCKRALEVLGLDESPSENYKGLIFQYCAEIDAPWIEKSLSDFEFF